MPRMTAKYKTALHTARTHGIPVSNEQEVLYLRLNDAGFWWDSTKKQWIEFAKEPAHKPTPVIRVRVWAEAGEKLQRAVSIITWAFAQGYDNVQESKAYPCRPPKQLESRVYLEFEPNGEKTRADLIKENDPYAVEIA